MRQSWGNDGGLREGLKSQYELGHSAAVVAWEINLAILGLSLLNCKMDIAMLHWTVRGLGIIWMKR